MASPLIRLTNVVPLSPRLALTLTLAICGGWALAAQGRQASPESQVTFKAGVEIVTVSASVRDDNGRTVRNLQKSDFEVIDSGVRTEIRNFYSGDSPISLAVLLDVSGSMSIGGNIDRARHAVELAMTNLRAQTDEAALFTFDSTLQEVVPFTKDLNRVRRVGLKGKPWGVTSLYDAIGQAARTVGERTNKHRALFVITDGVDTHSKMTAAQVSGIASSIDVPVYLLTVVNPVDHPGSEFEAIQTSGKAAADTASLADLARWTGGDIRFASVPAHASEAVRDLFEELRYQYLITFEPGERPGWHPLEIRTRKKSLVVHARSGYMASLSRSGS
jgi:VWFA-related protein